MERAIEVLYRSQVAVGQEHRDKLHPDTMKTLEDRGLAVRLGKRVPYWSLTQDGIEAYRRIEEEASK